MKSTTLSEQFQNPIEKSLKEIKIEIKTPNTQILDWSLSWLNT